MVRVSVLNSGGMWNEVFVGEGDLNVSMYFSGGWEKHLSKMYKRACALEALTAEKISVGAPFFSATFGPLFLAILFAVPFGPMLAWKRGDLLGAAQRLVETVVRQIQRRHAVPGRNNIQLHWHEDMYDQRSVQSRRRRGL